MRRHATPQHLYQQQQPTPNQPCNVTLPCQEEQQNRQRHHHQSAIDKFTIN